MSGRERYVLVPAAIVMCYDGTLEGFLSCIFRCFVEHVEPESIEAETELQERLFCETWTIETNQEHAERVRKGIAVHLTSEEYERVRCAWLSDNPERGVIILRYLALAFNYGRHVFTDLTNPKVAAFEYLWKAVSNERHRFLEFSRFTKLEGGIYFSRINPNANVVPLIMGHFSARFNTHPFIIYDEVHHLAGVYDMKTWCLVPTDELNLPPAAEGDEIWNDMWRDFYNTICNYERFNPALRTQLLPQRLWRNLTEFDNSGGKRPEKLLAQAGAGTAQLPGR